MEEGNSPQGSLIYRIRRVRLTGLLSAYAGRRQQIGLDLVGRGQREIR